MNYYYDILLNWNEEKAYEFYEWNDTDYLEYIKKIPLFKIKHKDFLELSTSQIKISAEFLKSIEDRTVLSSKNVVNKIHYACLFTDGKNVLALEFNDKGVSTYRSKLMVDDELNILEVAFTLKEALIDYESVSLLKDNHELRQIEDAKQFIILELNNLYQKHDIEKLKYLFYEYKKVTEDNIEIIYQTLKDEVLNHFNQNILKLYYIIKLSYHNV